MRAVVLGLWLVGCSGKGDDGGDTSGDTAGGPGAVDACDGLPQYDVASMGCAELGDAFESTIYAADACVTDTDCKVVSPQCQDWNSVACNYAANTCLPQTTIDAFNNASPGCPTSQPCSCTGQSPTAVCTNGICALDFGT